MTQLRSRQGAAPSLRWRRWQGDPTVAQLVPLGGPTPARALHSALGRLATEGFHSVLTPALGPAELAPFLQLGFSVLQRLHLCAHDLATVPSVAHRPHRRARRRDRPAALAVDAAAFERFWRLDDAGLDDALSATPVARFRVATTPGHLLGEVVGYAVTGRSGQRAYLQRLAVQPSCQRMGVGAALVVDGLRWARRSGAREVLVNTQAANGPALALYERLGFRRRPDGLAVVHRALDW